jgi:hypothetical protein
MKKSKRILAVTLALIMTFSVMVVGASTISVSALSRESVTSISYNKDASVSLTWSKNGSCTYYQIARKKLGDKNYTYTDVGYFSGQYYNDKNVVSGTIYYYQVRPVIMLAGGKTYGPWSSTKAVTTLYRPTVTSLNDMRTKLNINWNKIKGVSHYRLAFKRLSDKAWNYRTVKSTYYNVSNPTPEETYAVQVCPMNGNIAGQWSEARFIRIGFAHVKPVFESITPDTRGKGYTSIIWSFSLPCEKYYLYTQKAGDGYWTHDIIDDTEGFYNYSYTHLQNGNTYYFQVRALDKYGNWGAFSKVYTYQAKQPDESEKKDLRKMLTSHKWRYSIHEDSDYMKLDYDWLLEFKKDGTWAMDMNNSVDDDPVSHTLRGTWRIDGTALSVVFKDEEIPEFNETDLFIFADDMTDEKIEAGDLEPMISLYDVLDEEMFLYRPQGKWYVSDKYFCLHTLLFNAE